MTKHEQQQPYNQSPTEFIRVSVRERKCSKS
jgi:hypothetical protein